VNGINELHELVARELEQRLISHAQMDAADVLKDAAMRAKDAEIADWQKRTEDRAMKLDAALAKVGEKDAEIARLREGLREAVDLVVGTEGGYGLVDMLDGYYSQARTASSEWAAKARALLKETP
jgi:hypothetical protein